VTDPGIAALDDLLVQTFAMLRAIAENNLQAHPEARGRLVDGTRDVVAHAATGAERHGCGSGGEPSIRVSTATPATAPRDRRGRPPARVPQLMLVLDTDFAA
jgi:hypothetical protein